MVLTESDSDVILVEPMKNRTSGEVIRAYQALIDRLHAANIVPKHHILDNECSEEFKTTINSNNMTYQLVPPHDHRRNRAEKAIQIFKGHFVAILCGADKEFPLTLWDLLLPQAEATLNMLRPSRMTPAYLHTRTHGDNTTTTPTPLRHSVAKSKPISCPAFVKLGHRIQPADSTSETHQNIIVATKSSSTTPGTQEYAAQYFSSTNI